MQNASPSNSTMRCSPLGFGCSAVLGRAGRKASLAALGTAYDAGITFYDTARSYGYGESEALLGEFLHNRRHSVTLSTKFGILPTQTTALKQALKPLARTLLRLAPSARKAMQHQIAAQFSPGHFTVAALRSSLETSLRKLHTDYIDLLFLHEPPAAVLEHHELFAALQTLVAEGKLRRFGISCSHDVLHAALRKDIPGLTAFQFPCNLFSTPSPDTFAYLTKKVLIANQPFGGRLQIATTRGMLQSIAHHPETPSPLSKKLAHIDDLLLADIVLNTLLQTTPVDLLLPSMMQPVHIRANVAAIQNSHFSSEELKWLRTAFIKKATANPLRAN